MRVLILNAHDGSTDGLEAALDIDDVDIVGRVDSLSDAIETIDLRSPDVTVVELRNGDRARLDLIEQLLAARPRARLVLLTDAEHERVLDAVRMGVTALASRDQPSPELRDVMRRAARGEILLPRDVVERIVHRVSTNRAVDAPTFHLSSREQQILRLIAAGVDRPAIAERLGLSPTTVNTHLKRIRQKLGTHSVAEAATLALRAGIFDDEPAEDASGA